MTSPIQESIEYISNIRGKHTNSIDDQDSFYFQPHHQKHDTILSSRIHSLLRRMSTSIQRDDSTPDKHLGSNPSAHDRAIMLKTPHYHEAIEEEPEEEDCTLPTVEQCVAASKVSNQQSNPTSNYFENPFDSTDETLHEEDPPQVLNQPIKKLDHRVSPFLENQINSSSPQEPVQNKANFQWSKAIGKIKVVNSLSAARRKSSTTAYTTSKQPLAPYFPAAFTPAFLSRMIRDEHDRKPPPLIFDVLNASITDSVSGSHGHHRHWVFRIELQYGEIKWVINRTLLEFYDLHMTLIFKHNVVGALKAPIPSFPAHLKHLANAALASMRISREEANPEALRDDALKRRAALETYLRHLIQNASLEANYDLCEFLELGSLSILKDMGWKGKEGYLDYRAFQDFKWWQKEWVMVRDSYIGFCKDISTSSPTEVLLLDRSFRVVRSPSRFGSIHQTHFIVSNAFRRIELKTSGSKQMEDWLGSLEKVQKESPWVKSQRFESFAPVRENVKAKWFVDGHDYYEAVIESILSAKNEIYIEDWWLSPQLYLRRPAKGNEEYRLDRLLKRKATEGVMIYIVVYKNVSVALPIDSQHTLDWMQNVHPNIIIQRHASLTSSPFWAHHEKILVIDHRLAFVGGLDLCFGRYDTPAHELSDHILPENEIFPGQDYSNPRIKDFEKVSQYDMQLIDKKCAPRMPWHDIHVATTGPPARDIARHFIQRWNLIKSHKPKERNRIPFLLPKGEYVAARDESKFKGTCKVQVLRSSSKWSQGIEREFSIYSAYMDCIIKAKHFIYIENQFFITATRDNDKLIRNKIGEAIVNRIKTAHRENKKFRVIIVIPVAPGFEGDFTQTSQKAMALRSVAQYQYRSISRGEHSVFGQLRKENIPIDKYIGFFSLRNWGKIKHSANPILRDSIGNIIPPPPPPPPPTFFNNRVLTNKKRMKTKSQEEFQQTPVKEATRAHNTYYMDDRLDFVTEQVYIHSKLMIVDDKTVICGSANLNDRSQLGNRDSEIALIIEDTDLVDSKMNGQYYKASRYALTLRMRLFKEHLGLLKCGDTNASSTGVHGYRGMSHEDLVVMDPLDDNFYNEKWVKTAKQNTLIYRDLFHCVPDDTVHNVEQHRKFVPDPTRVLPGHIAEPWNRTSKEIQSCLNGIQGHLVEFPAEYMRDTSLTTSVVQEAFPPIVFT